MLRTSMALRGEEPPTVAEFTITSGERNPFLVIEHVASVNWQAGVERQRLA